MTPDIEDTIVAIASAPGGSVRGIVRVAGPGTVACLSKVFLAEASETTDWQNAKSTSAFSGSVGLAVDGSLSMPTDLLLWPTAQSYTRQPTAELHTFGSPPLLQKIVDKICESGARLANPGEFTLRAFLSGRIDMTQAEAVLAVIDSQGETQLNTALRQLAGGLAGPLSEVKVQLMGTLAELEAGLDFVEEDIEFISQEELTKQLTQANDGLQKVSQQILRRDLTVDSAKVVLFGLPNSGKSSLFNRLIGRDEAIVTDIEGTTTDFVSGQIELSGIKIELVDTAGYETSGDKIKTESQSHRQSQQEQAVVRLHCIDGSKSLGEWDLDQLGSNSHSGKDSSEELAHGTIIVVTKSDLDCSNTLSELKRQSALPIVPTSSLNADGLDDLNEQICQSILSSHFGNHSVVGSTILRASQSLKQAEESVQFALEAVKSGLGEELVAAEIRRALDGLGQVAGTVYTDDILDLVFGRFCIGK